MTTRKIATAIATGALLFSTFAQTAFAADITITGNGSDSRNSVDLENKSSTTVVQSNDADITNKVSSNATTGGNNSNSNTGGSVSINTGSAQSGVNVANAANLNQASLPCSCLDSANGGSIEISGNGHQSKNSVDIDGGRNRNTSEVTVDQSNNANFHNYIDSNANTGKNDANSNTGSHGDSVSINTGKAVSSVGVSNAANANIVVADPNGPSHGSGWEVAILGNAEESHNKVDLDINKSVSVVQSNSAYIKNKVDSDANTGKNDANSNTGGDVSINTGDAGSAVQVDNLANFNFANIGCGCVLGSGLDVAIAGNGHKSHNSVDSDLKNNLSIFQGGKGAGNDASLHNYVDGNAKTGYNDSNSNTGSVWGGGSVSTETGRSESVTGVSSSANVNQVGSGDLGFDFGWNFGDLWSFFNWV